MDFFDEVHNAVAELVRGKSIVNRGISRVVRSDGRVVVVLSGFMR